MSTPEPVPIAGQGQIVCPHCQTRGGVTSRRMKEKRGVSGGKLVFAVLTLGISILFVGLSRKQEFTRMTCGNCHTKWLV